MKNWVFDDEEAGEASSDESPDECESDDQSADDCVNDDDHNEVSIEDE